MVIKILFERTTETIPFSNQKQLNGFNHKVLGKGNEYHDRFSDYCMSGIQGGRMREDRSGIVFDGNPYMFVSSPNPDFIDRYTRGVNTVRRGDGDFFGLKPIGIEYPNVHVCNNSNRDVIVTMSPILLKRKDRWKLTFEDDGWDELLNWQCAKKLNRQGIHDDSFRIIAANRDKLKRKNIEVGGVRNPCTSGLLTVYGEPETRRTLYDLGIGNSTGSGFGFVSVYR